MFEIRAEKRSQQTQSDSHVKTTSRVVRETHSMDMRLHSKLSLASKIFMATTGEERAAFKNEERLTAELAHLEAV